MSMLDQHSSADAVAVTLADLETHRRALTGFCYRMLGSAFEADDAVQETMVRAWRSIDRYEGRGPLEAWLFRIATNVCLNALRDRKRRARPIDLAPSSPATAALGAAQPAEAWVEPMPDARLIAPDADPEEAAAVQESVRLAFVAALQLLPPRQRAVLILRDVLRWHTEEVATLLDTSPVSVKSALQRARSTLAAHRGDWPSATDERSRRELLDRYLDAFQRYDVDALVALLHEEATLTMPPFALWLRGPADIGAWWRREASNCGRSILVPIAANGALGFAQYRPLPQGGHEPFAIKVLDTDGERITAIDVFFEPRLFDLFGLPARPDQAAVS
jgi:RNA polymerase sigma-70 factor, ECF subfamily